MDDQKKQELWDKINRVTVDAIKSHSFRNSVDSRIRRERAAAERLRRLFTPSDKPCDGGTILPDTLIDGYASDLKANTRRKP